MQLRILGPLHVVTDDGQCLRFGPRQAKVLAALLLAANNVVSIHDLIDAVWGDNPPATARRQISNCVWMLRRDLPIFAGGSGYSIVLREGQLDAHRFADLVTQAQAAATDGRGAQAVEHLTAGLALWRGPALSGVVSNSLRAAAARLDEQRLTATELRLDLELQLGHHHEVVGELTELAAAYPLREHLVGQLMCALYRSGRQAEALAVYQQLRARLADELGVDPSIDLQQLHTAILRNEVDPPGIGNPPAAPAVPRQLPAAPHQFTGRVEELDHLAGLLEQTAVPGAAIVITAIGGTAGVGKTTLAVHWAHQIADRFPGGQLYVNLRGFDPGGSPVEPAAVIRDFLDALEVPRQRIPLESSAQAALYRSLLAQRRMLVVLDNARDAEQVRPLLPGAPGSLVVITSRDQLAGLVATHGAYPLTLDLFSAAESRAFLARRLGAERVAAQTGAVNELVGCCARLPLALAIAATRAAARRDLPLADLAAELRDARGRLDAFDIGDARADVRAVFSWSYEQVSPPAARLFRLLGLHPRSDITVAAAASLAGVPRPETRSLLHELSRAHLVAEDPAGRYTWHDLLNEYAAEQARRLDTNEQLRTAIHRMLDHYLHTTHTAALLLQPERQPLPLPTAQPGVVLDDLTDTRQALSWFAAERPTLLAAVDRAVDAGLDTHALQLARCLSLFLDRGGHWQDQARTLHTALGAAQRLGDQAGQADVLRNLGGADTQLHRFDDADNHLQHSLRLFRKLNEPAWQAHTHMALGWLCVVRAQHWEALNHAQQALVLFRAAGDDRLIADALNNVGWAHAKLGNLEKALTCCQDALNLLQQLDEHHGQADTWDSLGYIRHQLGQHPQATACYRQALDLYRETGDRLGEAQTLERLGDTHHASGDPTAAHAAWQDALTILDELDHPDATTVRAKRDRVVSDTEDSSNAGL